MLKLVALFSIVGFCSTGMAIDTDRCPSEFTVISKVTKVNKKSIYSGVPGWKTAQMDLLSKKEVESTFKLVQKKNTKCTYIDDLQNTALLTTSSFADPEEQNPVLVDQIILNFKINNSKFVTFVPIESYSQNGIEVFANNGISRQKVKAKLFISGTQRYANIDLGMIEVVVN